MSKTKELSRDSHPGPLVCRECDSVTLIQDEPPFSRDQVSRLPQRRPSRWFLTVESMGVYVTCCVSPGTDGPSNGEAPACTWSSLTMKHAYMPFKPAVLR